jgi:peptide/nickel transport system substrate-binding protein
MKNIAFEILEKKTVLFLLTNLLLLLGGVLGFPSLVSAFDDKVLTIAMPLGPSIRNVDPAVGWNSTIASQSGITETLAVLDSQLNLKPWLAESYRNLTSTIWEVKLRQDVKFHDGLPMDAKAAKWSFDRIIDEKSKTFNVRAQKRLDLKSISVIDDYTLNFETNNACAFFLYKLASPDTAIISPRSNPMVIYGTGPYMLSSCVPKEKMDVCRFDDYWRGKPKLGKIHFKYVLDTQTRMLAFESGQVDIATDFPETDAQRIQSRDGVKILHRVTHRLCFFFVRVKDGPLANGLVRKALNHAINRQEIVDTVLSGLGGEVAASIYPRSFLWYNNDLTPNSYDPRGAREYLFKAGAVDSNGDGILELNGRDLLLNLWTYEGRPVLRLTAELVQAQLRNVGIGTRIRVTQKSSAIDRAMSRGDVQLNLQLWNVCPQGEPNYFISLVLADDAELNCMGYANPKLNDLFKEASSTFSLEEGKNLYHRIQQIISDDSPVIPLFYESQVVAIRDYVRNLQIHPAEIYFVSSELSRE